MSKKSALNTAICQKLGISYPVMQAGMGLVATGRLAGEVSKAGGLGVIGAGYMTPDELRHEIQTVRQITDKPFAVDILFGKPQVDNAEASAYSENVQAQIDVSLAEKVPILISGLGSPAAIIEDAHARGIIVMSVIGNLRQAIALENAGVDVLIASGSEGGGHVGNISTVTLVPAVVDAVKVPVIAGGGLADGRGLVAALALGAQGVWMGTRFIATPEANAHKNYGEKIVATDVAGTIVTRCHSGKTARLIKNEFTAAWDGREHEIEPFPLQLQHVGGPASRSGRLEGDVESGSLPAGQGSGLIHSIKGAAQIVTDVIDEAEALLDQLTGSR